jgi:hypothetical protein
MNWTKLVGFGLLAGLLGGLPALAGEDETTAEEAAKQALSGGGDPRRLADKVLEPVLPALDELFVKSKDRPEKVLQSWDSATGEHLQRFRALANMAEGPSFKRALPSDWREYRRSREAFMEELRSAGKDAALWRHQTRLLTESLKTATATFPARRDEWQKRLTGVEDSLGKGEALLKDKTPDPKKIDAAVTELTGAGAVAANVAFDAMVVAKQSQASLGKAAELPTNVQKAQQGFAAVDERHKDIPQGWRDTVRGWAEGMKQVQGMQRTAQEQYDRAFSDVVKQLVFQGFPHFKGKQYAEFVVVVGDLISKLRLAKAKAEERAERERLQKQDRELNAKECKEFEAFMDATSAEKHRAATLKLARGCGAEQCYEKRLVSARGPCSATALREAYLKLGRFDGKGTDPEEQKLQKFVESCENNTNAEQQKLDQACDNVCGNKGPECKKFNDEWDEYEKSVDKEIKEQRKRDRKRDERRRKIGLDPDPDWRDCP